MQIVYTFLKNKKFMLKAMLQETIQKPCFRNMKIQSMFMYPHVFFFISSIIDFREKIKYVAWNENQKYLVALYWAKISYFWRVEKKFEFCEQLKLVHQEKLSSWKLFYINDIFSSTMQGGGDRQNICEM